jgi:hypothetical protein
VGKTDLRDVTYCRIVNTLELVRLFVSENLVSTLYPEAHVASDPFSPPLNAKGDFADWNEAAAAAGGKPVETVSHG